MAEERWVPIADAPDYEVSNHGRVRSTERVVQRMSRWGSLCNHKVQARVLKPGYRQGYPFVSLHVGDTQIRYNIHWLVIKAFGPPKPEGADRIRHLDDVRANANIDNLAWGNQKENMADAIRNGRVLGGYRPKGAMVVAGQQRGKMTPEQVAMIRADRARGIMLRVLAEQHGVSQSVISEIANNKAHVS